MTTIKVASYNMRKGIGTDRRRSPERVLDVLREIDDDVIALQEADRRFGVRAAVLTPHLLEEHSDWKTVPLSLRAASSGWHGNAILVRKDAEIRDCQPLHLPVAFVPTQSTVSATSSCDDTTIDFGATATCDITVRNDSFAETDIDVQASTTPNLAIQGPDQLSFTAAGDPAEVAAGRLTLSVIRDELARIVAQRAETDPYLHYLDGRELYGEADHERLPLPDALHPDAATHRLIGERFADLAFGSTGPLGAQLPSAERTIS